jgi:rhodanese-related sulfurtransferase
VNDIISASELKEFLQRGKAQLVDVRAPSEYAAGHLPTAINIPMEQVEARLQDLRPDCPMVLICQSGRRAEFVANLLQPYNLDLSVLEGGTCAWAQASLPFVRSAKSRWGLERQVRLVAGLLIIASVALVLSVSRNGVYFAGFIGLGLTFAGLTDICPMASLLCRMPWNQPRSHKPAATPLQGGTCALKNVPSGTQQ